MIDRRSSIIRGGLMALIAGFAPKIAFARAETDHRFVFIIQRGAADGLGIVAPIGEPAFAGQRGRFAEDFTPLGKLDGLFSLHSAMPNLLGLYRQGQALFVQAVASPYRDRSHFDGQNVLETGSVAAHRIKDGWMNRMLSLIPSGEAKAIAVAATVPLALRGTRDVASYSPSALPGASDDLLQRVSMLYADDSQLHSLWSEAMATRELRADMSSDHGRNAAATGTLTAQLLATGGGARIAMIETGGWDTHTQQRQRLSAKLAGLDMMIQALRNGLGPIWKNTTVLVATEFGRTVTINGTAGTDHGTGAVSMLLGGSVKGGRVLADWPGIAPAQLYEGRDLRPTMKLDAVIATAVAESFGIDPSRTATTLFPGRPFKNALSGLVA